MTRILGLDPGALRLGFALVESSWHDNYYRLYTSGIKGLARGDKEKFGDFRHRLIAYWVEEFGCMLDGFERKGLDKIVSETLPAVGGGNFIAATQSELAKTAITTCQVIAYQRQVEWVEMAANTIKKKLTGNHKATKVGVRNAVISVFPELLPRKKELTVYADEADAIGTALVGAGYTL